MIMQYSLKNYKGKLRRKMKSKKNHNVYCPKCTDYNCNS